MIPLSETSHLPKDILLQMNQISNEFQTFREGLLFFLIPVPVEIVILNSINPIITFHMQIREMEK